MATEALTPAQAALFDMDVSDMDFQDNEADEQCPVLPENWAAVALFVQLATCWRIDGSLGMYLGLDYPAVEVVMNMQGLPRKSRLPLFNDLQIMERAVLNIINNKDKN